MQQRVEDDLQLHAGEVLAEALMGSEPERQVMPRGACDVELVRLGETSGSRLAACPRIRTPSPARMVTPPISVSFVHSRATTVSAMVK
jgi:hypothetical protein